MGSGLGVVATMILIGKDGDIDGVVVEGGVVVDVVGISFGHNGACIPNYILAHRSVGSKKGFIEPGGIEA